MFFLIQHSLVKYNLFLIGGMIHRTSGTTRLRKLGNLITRQPLLAWLFLISGLSLAGVPPFSGFWAKLALVKAGFEIGTGGAMAIIGVCLAVGLCTLLCMIRIWNEAFWQPVPEVTGVQPPPLTLPRRTFLLLPILILTVLILYMGLYPEPLLHLVHEAAGQLTDKQQYIKAVLGEPSHAGTGS